MYSIYKTRGFINHENLPDKDQWGQTPVAPAQSAALFAAVLPLAACDRAVSWSTSDAQVATVSEDGSVTGVAAGTATITVTTKDGSKTAVCTVTVKNPVISITGVKLDKTALTLDTGKTQKLTATVSPTNATNKSVTWKSSNTAIATVASDGTVKAVKAGTVTITVTTADGKKTASCNIPCRSSC